MTEQQQTGTDIIVVEALVPAVVFGSSEGVDDIITKLKAKAAAAPKDISTKAGRTEIISFAYKMAQTKTALDKMGKELVDETKKSVGAIDAERRRLWDAVEELQREVRKPVTDWEEAEKTRVAAHEEALLLIWTMRSFQQDHPTADEIRTRIGEFEAMPGRDWQEFNARAIQTVEETRKSLSSGLERRIQADHERAELDRLRRAEELRLQHERDQEIARQAAEQARLEEERKAAALAEANRVEQERLEEERQAEIKAREEAEGRTRRAEDEAATARQQMEEQRLLGHEQALLSLPTKFLVEEPSSDLIKARLAEIDQIYGGRDWQEFGDRAAALYGEIKATLQQLLAQALDREELKRREDEQARAVKDDELRKIAAEEERRRIEAAAEAKRLLDEADQRRREADKAHRRTINTAAVTDLIDAAGLSKEQAQSVVVAIAMQKVRHVNIVY